jgi:non-ribosomal peptide synthetase component F
VDAALHGAMIHSDLPFHKIVEAVQPPRDPSRTPLFQINFRAPQQPYPRLELDGINASPVEVLDNGTAKFDLALEIGGFVGGASYFEYCTDLFSETRIIQMAQDFRILLTELIARPDVPVSHLDAVTEISRRVRPQTAEVLR